MLEMLILWKWLILINNILILLINNLSRTKYISAISKFQCVSSIIKWIVLPKMKLLLFQTCKTFDYLWKTIFLMKSESFLILHRKQLTLFNNYTHASWHALLNKVIIFVFFVLKESSRSFVKLRLNLRCHMDCFIDVLTNFLGLEGGSCVAVYAGSESSRISSNRS